MDGGFQVRKKSGQVTGPYPETEVTRQLTDGRLLGNEEVSQDNGATWVPLGSLPAFAEALQRLMDAPSVLPTAPTAEGATESRSQQDVNEHFKQIYGGRMAGINIEYLFSFRAGGPDKGTTLVRPPRLCTLYSQHSRHKRSPPVSPPAPQRQSVL